VEERSHELLSTLRPWDELAQGYGPANLVTLLRLLRGDLRGLNLSQLALRGVELQGVELQDANLSIALIRESVLSETFDVIAAVAISRSGQFCLLWLRQHYQSGGSDHATVMHRLEFLRYLVRSGKLEA
jgi:hypothetical protein